VDVGVRELKQRLSEYLERAARGERIIVTDRGRRKAVLGPLPGGDNLERGLAEGWITPPQAPSPPPVPPARFRASVSVREMIEEDRGEE
jgi:prevent-host-death family protein